ncbi:hypothetical protein TRFO_36487 [Tritrichomonas foetus]|uniref:Intimal thickness related receptor IRP domain-containing protein n=1 Tax=Tritrichomonas foetus TaxID=1144522 RepID=A0A1J4JII0_9EUKA|nr:hypothetical protein TRFO_36487 [Tritrichomonas foetus]|eukprot:OHS97333.1 hypothetical protein TRFO_36487 [Tritrichomonas foetus]
MFLSVFHFLCYLQTRVIEKNLTVSLFSTYGITYGGTFFVNITQCDSKQIFVGLSVEEQVKNLWDSKFDYRNVCKTNNHNKRNHMISDVQSNLNFSIYNVTINTSEKNIINAIINYTGVVTPIFIMCDTNYTFLNTTVIFKNPRSYIDSRNQMLLITTPLHGILYFVTIVCLIVVILSKGAIFIKFHLYLIATLLLLAINVFSEFWLYINEMKAPDSQNAYFINYATKHCAIALLFTLLTLASGGWQIHTVRFGVLSFVISMIAGFSFAGSEIVTRYLLRVEPDLISYGAKIISLFLLAKASVVELRMCEQYLQSYALIIDAVGIDSKTTPLRRRLLMQYIMLCTLVVYFIFQIAILHVPIYVVSAPKWIVNVINHGINNLLMIVLTINYMPWKISKGDWFATFDDEDRLIDCAMEDFNPEAYPACNKPKTWNSGEPLPLPPLIAADEYRIQSYDINDKEMPLINNPSM